MRELERGSIKFLETQEFQELVNRLKRANLEDFKEDIKQRGVEDSDYFKYYEIKSMNPDKNFCTLQGAIDRLRLEQEGITSYQLIRTTRELEKMVNNEKKKK